MLQMEQKTQQEEEDSTNQLQEIIPTLLMPPKMVLGEEEDSMSQLQETTLMLQMVQKMQQEEGDSMNQQQEITPTLLMLQKMQQEEEDLANLSLKFLKKTETIPTPLIQLAMQQAMEQAKASWKNQKSKTRIKLKN